MTITVVDEIPEASVRRRRETHLKQAAPVPDDIEPALFELSQNWRARPFLVFGSAVHHGDKLRVKIREPLLDRRGDSIEAGHGGYVNAEYPRHISIYGLDVLRHLLLLSRHGLSKCGVKVKEASKQIVRVDRQKVTFYRCLRGRTTLAKERERERENKKPKATELTNRISRMISNCKGT
ncbi:MAG: hypothetical protein JNL98_33065 [Bryobacterales bacterium]|nr:hypothetical protein [Bryobacterales bacterium]